MEIRSYRSVFDLERRIYRVDRLRLNPGGIPVRGVMYFLALLLAALLSARLPVLGALVDAPPWYLRDLALPALSAAALTMIRIEGRPFHLAARALLRYRCGARRLAGGRPCRAGTGEALGGRWRPQALLMLPDGSDSRMRRLRYSGPGAVLVAVAHRRETCGGPAGARRRRQLRLRESPGPAPACRAVIVLERAARLRVL